MRNAWLFIGFTVVTFAVGARAERPGSAARPAEHKTAEGRVLEATDREILIGLKGMKELRVRVVDATTVLVDGEQMSAAELPPGSDVEVAYDVKKGQNVAVRVEAKSQELRDRQQQKPEPGGFPEEMAPGQ